MTRLTSCSSILLCLLLSGCISSPGYLFSDSGVSDDDVIEESELSSTSTAQASQSVNLPILSYVSPEDILTRCEAERNDLYEWQIDSAHQALAVSAENVMLNLLCQTGGKGLAYYPLYIENIDIDNSVAHLNPATVQHVQSVIINQARKLGLAVVDKPVSVDDMITLRSTLYLADNEYFINIQALDKAKFKVLAHGLQALPLAQFTHTGVGRMKDGVLVSLPEEE